MTFFRKMEIILDMLDITNPTELERKANEDGVFISRGNFYNWEKGIMPTTNMLKDIVFICRKSNNDLLKEISYDYLVDDNIENMTRDNIDINEKLNLSDKAIKKINEINNEKIASFNIFLEEMKTDIWKSLEINQTVKKIYTGLINSDNLIKQIMRIDLKDHEESIKEYIKECINNNEEIYKLEENIAIVKNGHVDYNGKEYNRIIRSFKTYREKSLTELKKLYNSNIIYLLGNKVSGDSEIKFVKMMDLLRYKYSDSEKELILRIITQLEFITKICRQVCNENKTLFVELLQSTILIDSNIKFLKWCNENELYIDKTIIDRLQKIVTELIKKVKNINYIVMFQTNEQLNRYMSI